MDTLPVYAKKGDGLTAWVDECAADAQQLGLPLTHMRYNSNIIWIKEHHITVGMIDKNGVAPLASPDDEVASVLLTQKRIIETFFQLVRLGQGAAVAMFVEKGLVSPDVTDGEGYDNGMGSQFPCAELEPNDHYKVHGDPWAGATPLLAAIDARQNDMVKLLLALGADPNTLARPPNLRALAGPEYSHGVDNTYERLVRRTPLMLAASLGNLVVCTLLLNDYHADDAIVAPDGQIALRLAAKGKHRGIVALLPARHGGALQRIGAMRLHSMDRIRHAAKNIQWFAKVVVWDTHKFLFYTVPLECVLKPLGTKLHYLWGHKADVRKRIGDVLLHLPSHAWSLVRALGTALVATAKALGRAIKRIPEATRTIGKGAVRALKTIGLALASTVGRCAAAIHTTLAAAATFFHGVTLQNVLDGVDAALSAIFLVFPAAIVRGLVSFVKHSWTALCDLTGGAATLVHAIGVLLWAVLAFIPQRIWQIITAIGSSCGHATSEIRVLFNPKAI